MIEDFSEKNMSNGVLLKLRFKERTIYYEEDYNNGTFSNFFSDGETGIVWKKGGKTIEISEQGYYVKGFPTLDMEYVIVIKTPREEEYPRGKAYIYDEDGIMLEEISYPTLVSDLAKQKRPELLSFRDVSWIKIDLEYYLTIRIEFNFMWHEERIYDFNKREFGECVSSGRV